VSNSEIPQTAIERNRAWIKAVTGSLGQMNNTAFLRSTMRAAGKQCASQLMEVTVDHFGRTPASVDELIEAINKRRRELLKASTFWIRDGNKAHFTLATCSCDLVDAGLAEPDPNYCLCSAGMFESIFATVCKGSVKTDIIKAIGMGDDCCQFVVHFDEGDEK
jgi:hypothetical protein